MSYTHQMNLDPFYIYWTYLPSFLSFDRCCTSTRLIFVLCRTKLSLPTREVEMKANQAYEILLLLINFNSIEHVFISDHLNLKWACFFAHLKFPLNLISFYFKYISILNGDFQCILVIFNIHSIFEYSIILQQ